MTLIEVRELDPMLLPRDDTLEGRDLRLAVTPPDAPPGAVAITDGARTGLYVPDRDLNEEELQELASKGVVPDQNVGRLRILPYYTEAGRFCEANVVALADGERSRLYYPARIIRY